MAKANKQPKQATEFAIGDRVFVSNGATDGANCTGTVVEASRGWYNIKLDDPEACGKETVSARASSMLHADAAPKAPAPLSLAGQAMGTKTPTGGSEADDEGEEADDEGEDGPMTEAQRMSEALRRARARYAKTKRPNGASSASCNDRVAKALQDYDPIETTYVADKVMEVEQGYHAIKYGHLNPGQIRMNSGNRIRAAVKMASAKGQTEEVERIYRILGILEGEETLEDLS